MLTAASVALAIGVILFAILRRLGVRRTAQTRILFASALGTAFGLALGSSENFRYITGLNAPTTAILSGVLLYVAAGVLVGLFHFVDTGLQRQQLHWIATDTRPRQWIPQTGSVRFRSGVSLDQAMDRLTEYIAIRLIPGLPKPPDQAVVYEDWAEVEAIDEPHIILPSWAKVRRLPLSDGSVELVPRNPYQALVLLPPVDGKGEILVQAAADTAFTERVLSTLRVAR